MYGTSPSAHRIGNAPHLHQTYDWGRRVRSTSNLDTWDAAKAGIGLNACCAGLGPEAFLAFAGVVVARCFEGTRDHRYRPIGIQDGHSELAPGGCLQEPSGCLEGRRSLRGTPHGSEGARQGRRTCLCRCFLNILHVQQRSVRQTDDPFHLPCLLVKKRLQHASLYLLSLSLSPL